MQQINWSAAAWRKSTGSGMDGCVALARVGDVIGVRDSKLGDDSPVLEFNSHELAVFKAGLIAGEFEDLLA